MSEKVMATAIKLYVDLKGTQKLNKYLLQNRFDRRDRFHSTIFYTGGVCSLNKEEILRLISSYLPIEINPPYTLDIFGENELVLRYGSSFIKRLNEIVGKEEKPITEYTTFNPHITIAKNFPKGKLEEITDFREKISFDSIEWKVIKK
jgi:hypothetical protein